MERERTELLTCEEAIEILRCGYNTLYELLKSGAIPSYKEGRIWKIPYGGIQDYIKRRSGIR